VGLRLDDRSANGATDATEPVARLEPQRHAAGGSFVAAS
jgi:hypothetical protein